MDLTIYLYICGMKKMSDISKEMLELLEKQGEVSAAEFKAMMPGKPEQTVFSRIRALERKGLIYESGRGRYSLGAKPVYKAKVSPRMLELNKLLVGEFTGASLCISTMDGSNIVVETDRKVVDKMLVFLRGRYLNVFTFREAIANRSALKDAIVVKALITDSPLVSFEEMNAPSLEKTLVDLVADKDFFRLDDEAIHKEFQRAFEVYPINRNRLVRYAGRRGVTASVYEQMAKVDLFRVDIISKIQQTLKKQPVIRAWLFGSWSRMEERPDSDIDLLVDFKNSDSISLLDYTGFMLDIQDITGKQIDYVENGTLLPFANKNANQDKYIIYERAS